MNKHWPVMFIVGWIVAGTALATADPSPTQTSMTVAVAARPVPVKVRRRMASDWKIEMDNKLHQLLLDLEGNCEDNGRALDLIREFRDIQGVHGFAPIENEAPDGE